MVDKLDRLMQFCTVSEQNYYKDWYEKNRGDLLARRRAKYRSDPEYAEKCKENARDYRKRAKKTERKEGPQTRERKPVLVDVGGQQRKGWSVGHLAKKSVAVCQRSITGPSMDSRQRHPSAQTEERASTRMR